MEIRIGDFEFELVITKYLTPDEYDAFLSAAGVGTLTTPNTTATTETTTDDEEPDDFDEWFCIRTNPWPCPAEGCSFVANFVTAAHLIVIWPSADDRDLLTYARDCRELDRNPRVVPFEREFGVPIPYDRWVSIGRPVHATYDRPEGWRGAWRRL